MSENICLICGRDCGTPLALQKHETKCGKGLEFSNRHDHTGDKCPKCCETWAFFWKKAEDTWVCLQCGCHFTPKGVLTMVEDARLKG